MKESLSILRGTAESMIAALSLEHHSCSDIFLGLGYKFVLFLFDSTALAALLYLSTWQPQQPVVEFPAPAMKIAPPEEDHSHIRPP